MNLKLVEKTFKEMTKDEVRIFRDILGLVKH